MYSKSYFLLTNYNSGKTLMSAKFTEEVIQIYRNQINY